MDSLTVTIENTQDDVYFVVISGKQFFMITLKDGIGRVERAKERERR